IGAVPAPTAAGQGLVPSGTPGALDVGAGAGIIVTADAVAADLTVVQALADKGQPNGYASLDAAGVVPTTQLPPLAINNTFAVADQAAMLALTAQTGDMAVNAATGEVFVLQAEPASTLANWVRISVPATVTTVNGQTGTVLLTAADV